MCATPGEVFMSAIAGAAIGAFALHAWRTWREVEADDALLRHYGITQEEWEGLSEAQRRLSRVAFHAKRQERDRG